MEYSQLYMGKKTLSMPEMHIQIVISELRQSDNDLWLAPFASGWPQPRRVKRRSKLMLPAAEKGSVVWSPTVTAILVYDAMLSHKFSVLDGKIYRTHPIISADEYHDSWQGLC